MKKQYVLFIVCLLGFSQSNADIYKYLDTDGRIYFTDVPKNTRYKKIIRTRPVDSKAPKINNKKQVDAAPRIDPTQEIKNRCRNQMGEYGDAMVKACVDQDLEALQAIGPYLKNHKAIIGRCFNQMEEYGYAMVKACADQDIEAKDALDKY